MIQPLSILFGAGFTVAVATALGLLLLRWSGVELRREEALPLGSVTGAALLNLLVFTLGMVHMIYWWVFLPAGTAVLFIAWKLRAFQLPTGRFGTLPRVDRWLFGIVFGVFALLYFFYAMAPEMSPDGSTYHLGLIGRYFRAHGLYRITTHMYANLSQGIEMLYLFAYVFGRHSSAALVHLAFTVAATISMLNYGRRYGFASAGVAGALFFFVSPVIGMDGSTAYNDVATAAILFTMFYLLRVWWDAPSNRLLVPIGVLAGFCYAAKYTAGLAIPLALVWVGWRYVRQRQIPIRQILIVGLCAFVLVAPWMVRNLIWYDNPVSPFFNSLFPNPYAHISFETAYKANLATYALPSMWDIPLEVTVRGATLCGLLGPLFLLAPIALVALRWKEGRLLLLAALVFGIVYKTNIGTRFLIPPLPYVALAMAMVFTRVPKLATALVAVHVLLSWPSVIPQYSSPYAWRIDGIRAKAALRIEPEEEFLTRKFADYSIARIIEAQVPTDGRLLMFGQIPEAYTTRETMVTYQGGLNEILGNMLWSPMIPESQPTRQIRFDIEPRQLRKLRVVQTAEGAPEQWSITEFRIYSEGVELDRAPEWRLRAEPNPWDVQRAFDNSPATRWRSWQPIYDGMWIEVDFRADTAVDSVLLECSADQWNTKLRLEGATAGGEWQEITAEITESQVPRPRGYRRMVANELKRAGVRYIVARDHEFGQEDYRERPRAWGITLLGESYGSRLYRFE
jgi:F5/8 type C domain-containing protein/dolichyl-phosphate-mannose-protein mannosyltransferase